MTSAQVHLCPKCGCELEYARCWNACDEGSFDGYEDDPLWFDEGDTYPCTVCHGKGYLPYCPECQPGFDQD